LVATFFIFHHPKRLKFLFWRNSCTFKVIKTNYGETRMANHRQQAQTNRAMGLHPTLNFY
jgi:hypothetical protein